MSLPKVALVGANGNLGPSILHSLLTNSYEVTVLTRESSTSTYRPGPRIQKIPDSLSHGGLVTALHGQDVLVLCMSGHESGAQIKFIDAAIEAGVSRVVPADFGSCDSSDPRTLALVPLYPEKKRVRDCLIQRQGSVSWTSIVCGHFLDYGLKGRLWQIDVRARKARVVDGGEIRFSASLLRTVGAAVVGVLRFLEETKDRIVYVQSLATTQRGLLSAVEKVVGVEFEVEEVESDGLIKELKGVLDEKPGDDDATEDLVGVEGMVNADWTVKETFFNGLFGLPDEDLDALVREALEGMV